jgi:hypothetical protein
MTRPKTDGWSQPSLIPVYWPVVSLTMVWNLRPDSPAIMVAYDIRGTDRESQLLAKGIEWIPRGFDPIQRAELVHELHRRTLEHLSPF